jgi:hypothetical protein
MDKDGKPKDMTDFGSVYIKYSSAGGQVSQSGDAMLNGYSGSYRGVYFNPVLPDGEFRQYAVLPLHLFGEDVSRSNVLGGEEEAAAREEAAAEQAAAHAPPELPATATSTNASTRERVQELIEPLAGTLAHLGASLQVLDVDDKAVATSAYGV